MWRFYASLVPKNLDFELMLMAKLPSTFLSLASVVVRLSSSVVVFRVADL